MQAAGDLAQVSQYGFQPGGYVAQLRCQVSAPGRGCRLCGAQVQGEGDQSLLGAVVQVAFDTAAGGVSGRHDPRTRGGQGGLGFGVGDRGGCQFGEPGQPCLSTRWQRPRAGFHGHDAPQPPLNADRHADPSAEAHLAGSANEP